MAKLCAIDNNDYLSNKNLIQRVILSKTSVNDSLGINIIVLKHHQFNIYAVFIQDIQLNSLADLNGQLHIADQIVCINDIYFDSYDSTLANRAYQLLVDTKRLSFEFIIVKRTATTNIIDYSYAAVTTSNNDEHSCISILSTPFHVDMVLNTLWTQIEVVELTNDGSGLGFGISGNKSTGVVVKAIVPGSIADKDGRIHTGDHLFQINHVYVRGMSSEQVAGILRQCSEEVRLVVARSVREPTTGMNNSPSMSQRPSLTSENLTQTRNPSIDNDGIINNSQNKILLRTERLLESNHNLEKILDNLLEQSQHEDGTELLDVTLEKGDDGLGITVAGYVSPDSTNNDAIAGIFIRDIAEGSVSSRDGRLAVGDQIIEVNEQSLNGFSNVQALYLLQNTSSSVRLKVRRYIDGVKHEKIKEMISLESSNQAEEKIEFQNQLDINEQIRQKWIKSLGNNCEIFIIDIYKPDNGSLGITLEGTIDIENGEKIGAHHYIRNLLSNGIIANDGTLKPGDELLEINNQILYGKNHINVIEILKRVKQQIKLVCARRKSSQSDETNRKLNSNRSRSISFGKTTEIVVKAKSMGTLDSTTNSSLRPIKTRSLEVISNLALWSTAVLNIELIKSEHGLGFSVLDYQDPSNPSYSPVIVIRSLVAGGVAQLDGRILPGDRLVAVNDIILENMNLDDVIKILKSTPKGPVKLSLSKPLPYPKFKNDNDDKITTDNDQDVNNNRRLSRISKSKTTAEINNNHKRSASSHRSLNSKPIISRGIALSAPAILTKHEYKETLLTNENVKKKQPSSGNRREKTPKRTLPLKKTKFKSDEHLNISASKTYQTDFITKNLQFNLPEFIHFQSDHLILIPKFNLYPIYYRSRSTSAFTSPSKVIRPITIPQTTTNPDISSSSKQLSRSRHSYDTIIYYEKQQKYPARSIKSKFDPMSCFNEPELSSDDNNLIRSSSLNNRITESITFKDEDVIDIDKSSNNNIPIQTSKWSSSSKQSSRMASPALSTSSQSSGRVIALLNHEVIQLPTDLEHEILIKQDFNQLNLVVDASVDDGVNGCSISSITSTSIDSCLKPGDFILSINNENMRKISNAQARSIIRRASLIGSDISVIFISGDQAKQYKDPPLETLDFDVGISRTKSLDDIDSPNLVDTESLCSTLWGQPHTVILYRDEQAKNLGISIVGGKLDFSGPGNTIESCISGIFIKHVIPDSLAGRHSTLKTGDRILEVNGYNLRDATHDHAVEIIRSAQSPVYFIVQSLLDSTSHTQEENPLLKQYEYLNGDVLLIDIKRNSEEINQPLGLSLIGHRDPDKLAVYICDIQSDSLLGYDNRLEIGDQLLQVNDEILLGKAHSTVTSIIKSIKSEILNFIILRNPNSINDMALRNPYASSHVNEHDRLTSTSVFPPIEQTFEDEEYIEHKNLSNQITITNDNNNNMSLVDENSSFDVKPSLFNQENNELLPTLTNVNEKISSQIEHNGPYMSHMPIMSSSSSSSSLSTPVQHKTVKFEPILDQIDDPRKRQILVGKETSIEIDRGQSGLGLSVVGGSDTQLSAIIIHDIYEGCAAKRDGRLSVGDQILEVNSTNLRSATHEEAIQALRQTTNIVRMVILRGEVIHEEDKFDIITVDLIKKSGKGLGFSIIGRRHGFGVFISHIIEGSSAEKDGRLMSGDLILEVNGKDLRTAAYEHVAYTLKTLPHSRVYIKVGRLKVNPGENLISNENKARSRSSSANKINDR